ncbi:9630_t:CDS:2 [Dentiscutata erythropus]|uniref:9630_t:CDS:1 n=1 Tax=Dentiscutata erythropus TaxID=1348616 RepID=A0A9N9G6N2_9GLOM|nr:9630_t:CDS:2 [Dentiscutata erythropus]
MLDTILVLELLEKATIHLSALSYPTLGDIWFIFEGIYIHLENFNKKDNFTQCELAESTLQKLSEYQDIIDQSLITSAVLDPRIKLSIFLTQLIQNAHNQIKTVFEEYLNNSLNTTTLPTNKLSSNISNTRQYF